MKKMYHYNYFKLLRLALLFLLVSFNHQLYAAHALPEFDANYGIMKFGVKLAEANYHLSHTDTGYKFTQNTELYGVAGAFGSDTVSAVSLIDEIRGNLLLTKHKFTQTGREKNRNEDFSISWQTYKNTLKGNITGVVRSKEIDLKTDSEIWEVLSFQIPLMIEANENTKEYPYNALLKGKIDTYNFVLTSIKKVDYAGKEYKALQLVRTDPKKDRQLHIWLLPELNNIPFLIENYRKGKEHSSVQLESIQFNNEKPLQAEMTDDDDDF
jgi:hypothetical protein